ncbi:MAG: hypothetical protein NC912_00250 [Candidatus Omnitrophica bacterium]|nr:hypothetical protein [Candidatus Omnitrophota bacterium]
MKKIKFLILYFSLVIMIFELCACEAFVRKFTRKPKHKELPKEEMVLMPEEYPSLPIDKEELYRNYLFYWKSWQDELIQSLAKGGNHKKITSCVQEAIKNLRALRELLKEDMQKRLDAYIEELESLKNSLVKDVYGLSSQTNRSLAERIKRNILKEFSYNKIKDYLL